MMEDSDGNIHLKNLSLHPAANEEDGEREERHFLVCYIYCNNMLFHPALNWLFLGDTNRMIAEV